MRVILFDIDGTLIRTGGAGMLALGEAFQESFGKPWPIEAVPTSGRTDRGIIRDLFALLTIDHSTENWDRLIDLYLAKLGHHLPKASGGVLPGVHELLEGLSTENGIAMGLLTGNVERGAKAKLEHYDLWRHFAFGGFGDLHFDRDDVARAAFDAACAHLARELAPHDVVVVGDTPLDVACARAIGAEAIAVATGLFTADELVECKPDLLLESLDDAAVHRRLLGR